MRLAYGGAGKSYPCRHVRCNKSSRTNTQDERIANLNLVIDGNSYIASSSKRFMQPCDSIPGPYRYIACRSSSRISFQHSAHPSISSILWRRSIGVNSAFRTASMRSRRISCSGWDVISSLFSPVLGSICHHLGMAGIHITSKLDGARYLCLRLGTIKVISSSCVTFSTSMLLRVFRSV